LSLSFIFIYLRKIYSDNSLNLKISISFLRICLSFLILTSCSNTEKKEEVPSTSKDLKEAYKDAFLIGSAVNLEVSSGVDPISQNIIIQHFNTITPENVMKAEVVNPAPGLYDFKAADDFVAFGQNNKMFIVGHTLIWHNQTPAWFFQDEAENPNTPEAQIEQMRKHIETVVGRYAGKVQAWDVVNEVIDNDGSYRSETAWVKSIGNGDELVKHAFKFASEYAPDTELYYNDFNAWRPEKRDGIMRFVRLLQNENIRIDGIGIQGHWGLNYPKTEYIEAAIDSLEEFKTFLDPYKHGLPVAEEEALAKRYAELFEIFYRKKDKIDRVTLWGLHDGMSWKNDYPLFGRTNYPLLYDRSKQPKLALKAVLDIPNK
jgi:endo-1,4-beta-xylanase